MSELIEILIKSINELDLEKKIIAINEVREKIHLISPFKNEPVDFVKWVKNENVYQNDYNPNSVAPPEMELLRLSISEDGYTQPIVSMPDESEKYEVIDGFHRHRVGKECKDIQEKILGYLPIVQIREDQKDKTDRMASTIRHNRARGKHKVESMSDIVIELSRRNWSDEKIAKNLGMDSDEVLRLKQISGLAEMFLDEDFSEAWDEEKKDIWVRQKPKLAAKCEDYPFYQPNMEFEELTVLFGLWYAQGKTCAGLIGIRADESLNRYRTVAVFDKKMHGNNRYTTYIGDNLFNVYPIYDWKTEDIWRFHSKFKNLPSNKIYNHMHKAGVPISQQRLCQPYGDDQKKGLWLYHILEPETWFKLIARVNGANSGALYVQESGNITGRNKISKPENHTWKSFCNLLLKSLPKKNRDHYIKRFRVFIKGWKLRGYNEIPDFAPKTLEDKQWAPSYRRLCKVLLRNDYWCKDLGLTQPKSDAYGKYLQLKKQKIVGIEA